MMFSSLVLIMLLFTIPSSGFASRSLFSDEMKNIPENMMKYSNKLTTNLTNYSTKLTTNLTKSVGNSNKELQKERNFRAAIAYGLTFKRELEELEQLLVVKGLVTKLLDSNDFQSHYFSSSRDENVQKLIHNGIASVAISRYYTIQTYP